MAQVGVATEIVGSRKGGGDYTTGDAHETRVYQVLFDDHDANSIDARNATGVPGDGDPLVSGSSPGFALLALAKDAQPHPNDQTLWTVAVTYRTPKATDLLPKPNGTAQKWQVTKAVTPYPVEVPITSDATGKIIQNILGETFTPQPTRVLYDLQININFQTDKFALPAIDAMMGSSNGSTIVLEIGNATQSFAANTLMFNSWSCQENYNPDGELIASASYQLLYRSDTWVTRLPNVSLYHLAGTIPSQDGTQSGLLGAGGTNNLLTTDVFHNGIEEPLYLTSGGGVATNGSAITVSSFNIVQTASLTLWTALLSGIDGY